ncbi:MAG: hypothetical protein F9K44_14130 [Hyphomicrobiaceae bacterium]|nr:MAG: hypothetical protein F9K44_14130 [Hyphomicrobiaceae bacterium]
MRSISLKLAAALIGASALGLGTAQAAPVSPSGVAVESPATAEQVRHRRFGIYVGPRYRYWGHRRHYPGFSLYIGPGLGFYSGYYPSYYYYDYPYRRCWWSRRHHRRICRW